METITGLPLSNAVAALPPSRGDNCAPLRKQFPHLIIFLLFFNLERSGIGTETFCIQSLCSLNCVLRIQALSLGWFGIWFVITAAPPITGLEEFTKTSRSRFHVCL